MLLPLPPLHAAACMLEAVSAAAPLAELLAPTTAKSSAWRMAPSERGARLTKRQARSPGGILTIQLDENGCSTSQACDSKLRLDPELQVCLARAS